MLDIFCSAVASGGMHAGLFPPSLWRAEGDQRNQLSVRQRGKGRHINGLRGREGDIVVRKRGVPIIKDFGWRCAPRRTHGNAPDQLRSVTEPRWEKRGSLRCCCCCCCCWCCCLFCTALTWMSRDTEPCAGLSQSSDGYRARIGRQDLSQRCRVWAPGLTPFQWRRWWGNPARGWKCLKDKSQVQLETPAGIRASSLVRHKETRVGFSRKCHRL